MTKMANKKLQLGIFSFTSCEGCLVEFLSLEENLLDVIKHFDIINFPLANEKHNTKGPFDVAIIEGSIDKKSQIKELEEIRKNSKFLIAYGACAAHGCVQGINNFFNKKRLAKQVYGAENAIETQENNPLDKFIKVDYYCYGCPVYHPEVLNVLKQIAAGAVPRQRVKPVCYECRLNENECLLQKGMPCLGPVTNCGCNSICTNADYPCTGCRGPLNDENLDAFLTILKSKGFTKDEISRLFKKYAPTSDKWKELAKWKS